MLVLGEDLHHAPLFEVEVGRPVAFEGRVFDTLGLEQVTGVRATGQVLARVVDTFARLAPEVLEATIAHEDGTTELLTGTPEHPVHLAAEGRYAPLRELRPGDRLTTRDGTEAVLQQVERRYGDIEVYNVEVAGQHNYLADDLRVHNARAYQRCGEDFFESVCDVFPGFVPTHPPKVTAVKNDFVRDQLLAVRKVMQWGNVPIPGTSIPRPIDLHWFEDAAGNVCRVKEKLPGRRRRR